MANTRQARATCQICQRQQALANGVITHHGYTRPGVGFIIGDCYGAKALAWEEDRARLGQWLTVIAGQLANRQDYLRACRAGEITKLPFQVVSRGANGRRETTTIYLEETTPDMYRLTRGAYSNFANAMIAEIRSVTSDVKSLNAYLSECQARYDAWLAAPEKIVPAATLDPDALRPMELKLLRRAAGDGPYWLAMSERNRWHSLVHRGFVTGVMRRGAHDHTVTDKGRAAL